MINRHDDDDDIGRLLLFLPRLGSIHFHRYEHIFSVNLLKDKGPFIFIWYHPESMVSSLLLSFWLPDVFNFTFTSSFNKVFCQFQKWKRKRKITTKTIGDKKKKRETANFVEADTMGGSCRAVKVFRRYTRPSIDRSKLKIGLDESYWRLSSFVDKILSSYSLCPPDSTLDEIIQFNTMSIDRESPYDVDKDTAGQQRPG